MDIGESGWIVPWAIDFDTSLPKLQHNVCNKYHINGTAQVRITKINAEKYEYSPPLRKKYFLEFWKNEYYFE
jgi:hypothetical protein